MDPFSCTAENAGKNPADFGRKVKRWFQSKLSRPQMFTTSNFDLLGFVAAPLISVDHAARWSTAAH